MKNAWQRLMKIKYGSAEQVKIFFYLCVGGTAAVIEWLVFYLLQHFCAFDYLSATAVAFTFATLCHYIFGNVFVFVSGKRFERGQELSLVFLVSALGLGLNLLLMLILTGLLAWPALVSKITASFLVFFWNYYARKRWIF